MTPGPEQHCLNLLHLTSDDQRQNLILSCQILDATIQHHNFPVDEVKLATGDYFTFQ
ncbi:MAG: hypothetical protein OQK93_05215 [Gammaproteobacteria bacterium]|nr:hypothetical protein [Gammaproteobacteria bacterium]